VRRKGEVHTEFWWGYLRKRGLGVDGKIILKWIFKKWVGGAGAGLIWLKIGTTGEVLCYNKISGSIKCGGIS
jgi:hypothetical protein